MISHFRTIVYEFFRYFPCSLRLLDSMLHILEQWSHAECVRHTEIVFLCQTKKRMLHTSCSCCYYMPYTQKITQDMKFLYSILLLNISWPMLWNKAILITFSVSVYMNMDLLFSQRKSSTWLPCIFSSNVNIMT